MKRVICCVSGIYIANLLHAGARNNIGYAHCSSSGFIIFMIVNCWFRNNNDMFKFEPVFNIKEEDRISVKEGLAPGQNVIVIGQQNVSNGDKVIVTEEVE